MKDLSLLLDMTHKSNDLRKCLLGYDSTRNKTRSYKEQRVSTQKIQVKIDYHIIMKRLQYLLIFVVKDNNGLVEKTRHRKDKFD